MSGDRFTLILAASLAGVVAGCGGDTPAPEKPSSPTAVATAPAPTATKGTPSNKRAQALAPGGDEGVRERRAKKSAAKE